MGIILFLIAASLLLALGFLMSFLWAYKSGQFEDDYTPSVRILLDDVTPSKHQRVKIEENRIIKEKIETEPK